MGLFPSSINALFEDLLDGVQGKRSAMAVEFIVWFSKLESGYEALRRDEIRMDRANFRKAMKQAFAAGYEAGKKAKP